MTHFENGNRFSSVTCKYLRHCHPAQTTSLAKKVLIFEGNMEKFVTKTLDEQPAQLSTALENNCEICTWCLKYFKIFHIFLH